MQINYRKRNFGLDLMRAVAISLVVFSHTRWISDHYPKYVDYSMRLSGTIGVEIFFIISGFLIGKIVLREIQVPNYTFNNIKYFLFRRWFRTFPNYYLLLIINVFIWYFIYGTYPENLYKYFIYLQNFADTSLPFYSISWSLSVEQFSYVLGPFLLFFIIKLFPKCNRDKLFLIVTVLIIIVFTLTRIHFYYNNILVDLVDWNQSIRKVLIYRIDTIYYGFLLRYLYNKYQDVIIKNKRLLLLLGLIVIAILHVFLYNLGITVTKYPAFMIIFYLPLNSIAIAFLIPYMQTIEFNNKMIVKIVTMISLISYSIYLLHYTIILHTIKVIFPSDALNGISLFAYTVFYWGLTFVLSYLVYVYYEKPITKLRELKIFSKND